MVQFKDLINKQNDRDVREVVFAKGETIKVFEPAKDDIEKIYSLQESFIDENNPQRLVLTGKDVIGLFEMLTDIQGLEDLTEEEINEVIENPSMALIQTQHIIEGIVTEVYKMVILSIKNRILETDLNLETAKTSNELMERTLGLAQRDGTSKEYADKVEKAKAKIIQLQNKQDEVSVETVTSEPVEQIGKHDSILNQYTSTFGEVEDE